LILSKKGFIFCFQNPGNVGWVEGTATHHNLAGTRYSLPNYGEVNEKAQYLSRQAQYMSPYYCLPFKINVL